MTSDETGGLTKRAVASVVWTTVQSWALRATGLVTVVILARQLTPADFGVVAMAMALPPILQPLADLGLSTYMLQAKTPTRRAINTFFWYSLLAGLGVTGILFAAAPVLGVVLDTPEVVPIAYGIAPVALLIVLGAVPVTLLRREMRFRVIAIQSIIAGGTSQVVAIALALAGFGAWAIVWQTLTVQFVGLVLAWISTRFLPRFEFSKIDFLEMTRFGVKVVTPGVLGQAAIAAVNGLIVGFLGAAALGYLNIAQRLLTLVNDLTTSSLALVSTVLFSRIREDTDRLRAGYLRAISTTYTLVMPVMAFVGVAASFVVPLVFGDQWGASVPLVRILAIAWAVAAISGLDNALFIALGKPGTWLVYYVVTDAVTVLVTLVVGRYGLSAFAWGFLTVGILAAAARCVLVSRQLRVSWPRIAEPFARVALPTLLATGAGAAVGALVHEWPNLPALLVIGLVGAAVYLPALRVAAPSSWTELSQLIESPVRRLRAGIRRTLKIESQEGR